MPLMRWFGLAIVVVGIILLLDFFSKNVNPDVSYGNYGILALLFGCIVLGADTFARKMKLSQTRTNSLVPITLGWLMLSSGFIISFLGFLLGNQVMCSCPASGSCFCGVLLYTVMFLGGLIVAIIGAVLIVGGTILARRSKTTQSELLPVSQTKKPTIHLKRNAAMAVALTIVIVYALFSIWPGVYITSINEQGHGLPPPPAMTALTSQSSSGLQLGVGGSFTYVLHFSSVSSYPQYRIDKPSANFGFTITSMNATFPIAISPSNPSVTVVFHIRGPLYPYYGEFSIFLNAEILGQTSS